MPDGVVVGPPSDEVEAASEDDDEALDAAVSEVLAVDAAGLLVADRSFFAQPLPLNTIEGAEIALRTGLAPQIGQAAGPSAVTPWITSNRCPFGQR